MCIYCEAINVWNKGRAQQMLYVITNRHKINVNLLTSFCLSMQRQDVENLYK